ASVTGGNSLSGTVLLSTGAPSGGVSVTLSTSNLAAQPPPVVAVPAGATSAGVTVTTPALGPDTPGTLTAPPRAPAPPAHPAPPARPGRRAAAAGNAGHAEPAQSGRPRAGLPADLVRLERHRQCGDLSHPDLHLEQLQLDHIQPDGERFTGDDRRLARAAAVL